MGLRRRRISTRITGRRIPARRPGILTGSGPRKNAVIKSRWATNIVLQRTAAPGGGYYVNIASYSEPSLIDTHQPIYHDTWKSLYGKYQVLGVKYRCTFRTITGSTTADKPIMCYIYPHHLVQGLIPAAGLSANGYRELLEQAPNMRSLKFGYITRTQEQKTWRDKCTLKGFINLRRIIADFQDEQWQSDFDASPSNPFFLNYGFTDLMAGVYTDTINMTLRLTFVVRLLEPKVLDLDPPAA